MPVEPRAIIPKPPSGVYEKAKKYGFYILRTVSTGVGYSLLDFYDEINPQPINETDPLAHEWVRWQCRVEHLGSTETADDQVFSLDTFNWTNGAVDNSWTDLDYQTAANRIGPFMQAISTIMPNYLRFYQLAAYKMSFNDYNAVDHTTGKPLGPFAPSGPPVKQYTLIYAGTGTEGSHPAGCSTVTEVTGERKHWGRIYTPTLRSTVYGANGRLATTICDQLAAAYATMFDALAADELPLCVPITQNNKQPFRMLTNVIGVRVDDVPDVHRSRRPKRAQYHKILPTPAATQQPAEIPPPPDFLLEQTA